MNDERVLQLVSMAVEAETLEHEGAPAMQFPDAARAGRGWSLAGVLRVGAGLAAAAAVAVGLFWPVAGPAPVAPGEPGARADASGIVNDITRGEAPAPGAGRVVTTTADGATPSHPATNSPMLLAVFRQPDSRCDCVVWEPDALAGVAIEHLDRERLIKAAWDRRCADGGSLMLVVALDGPRELLPASPEEAMALATCFALDECGVESGCYESMAAECVTPGVTIIAEAIGFVGS
ncbi:MAG: hypothetical protein SFY69_06935 [Planctomycetota bacterium]|nr:hypothetical protein [Planctomycetota bacterium]